MEFFGSESFTGIHMHIVYAESEITGKCERFEAGNEFGYSKGRKNCKPIEFGSFGRIYQRFMCFDCSHSIDLMRTTSFALV